MCLNYQAKIELTVNKNGYIEAWKTMYKYNTAHYMLYTFTEGENIAIQEQLLDNEDKPYMSGFHCYLDEQDARIETYDWHKVVKVLIKPEDVITTGFQWDIELPTVVASKITIPEGGLK